MGQRSYFLISHLQELGVHISGTLPFLVEQELVIAAISTNGCMLQGKKQEPNSQQTQATYRNPDKLCYGAHCTNQSNKTEHVFGVL